MASFLRLVVILFLVSNSLLLGTVLARDWYISPFGDDGSTGSKDAPFKTLFKAVKECASRDTIVVMTGSYYASGQIAVDINIIAQDGIGTVFFSQPALNFNSVNISGVVFFGSTGGYAVRGCSNGNGAVTLTNCQFSGNNLAIEAFYCAAESYLNNCTFNNNVQDIVGGNGLITILNSVFSLSGGISTNGGLMIADSVFTGNSNPAGGAAISVIGGALTIADSVFTGHSNPAISVNGGAVWVKNTRFTNCSSPANGGAILASNKSVVNVMASTFSGNSAGKSGGAVYIQTTSMLSAFNCDFIDNTAPSGGAYSCDSTGRVQEIGCTFENSSVGNCLQLNS